MNFSELVKNIWAEPDFSFNLWEKGGSSAQLHAFIPKEKKSDGAIIAIPGGGYQGLSTYESIGYGNFFSKCGITVFALSYSVAPNRFPTPLIEARRAVRLVRENSQKYGINPQKIAVMGSSAGGHLTAMLSTYKKSFDGEIKDETDKINCIPNAQILCYSVTSSPVSGEDSHLGSYANLFGGRNEELERQTDPCLNVNSYTPPAFIWSTAEDKSVNVINSYEYAAALRRKEVPVEMHIFPYGHHGLGVSEDIPHVRQWTELLLNWLKEMDWLK